MTSSHITVFEHSIITDSALVASSTKLRTAEVQLKSGEKISFSHGPRADSPLIITYKEMIRKVREGVSTQLTVPEDSLILEINHKSRLKEF